ncbi:MAG: acetoacetate--CoA ligase [Actinobacteria bacterium]|nr:acetoacetate--CoA ligase [Actinomycetota bacterium]
MAQSGELLWQPSAERIRGTAMDRFRRSCPGPPPDSVALQDWSLAQLDDFWKRVWQECGVVGEPGPVAVRPPTGTPMLETEFFPEARISYAENLLSGGEREGASQTAIVFRREDGVRRELSWQELRSQVSGMAAFLQAHGVESGDVVAAWMPNIPETVVTMLAANSIGAVFTSTSPDFGVAGVLDRFGQVNPRFLVMADGYVYGGKQHRRLPDLAAVLDGLPSVEQVVVVPELGDEPPESERVTGWDAAVNSGAMIEPSRDAFSTPAFILYSSGTTGKPKCIVHSGPGVLLKQITEHQLHCDVRPGDRVFYYTTCGWMMWNWLVTMLASGATIVLYDGSPFSPAKDSMWRLAEDEGVSLFGTSAKFIDASRKFGVVPGADFDLSRLRTITSTGSPLSAEGFDYVYRQIKPDVHLASISGGTDLCGCFVLGDPTRPVYAGEIQGPALGTAAGVWDDEGRSLRDRPGERGELVCTRAFPSMPVGFANDPDKQRYRSAYFSDFPGVWAHGDFASWTTHGGVVIHGRSDATLNAGGVRIGTAEIYRQVELLEEVEESLAVGQEWDDDTRIVLFVRLAGLELSEDLDRRIRSHIRQHTSPRHVPAKILAVSDLPRTRSGKLAELAVTDVIHGRPVRNTEGLANPESLEQFRDLDELSGD